MPLISARNPDVLDIADIGGGYEKNSLLKRYSPVSISNKNSSDPEDVSVMTMHSAFQNTAVVGDTHGLNPTSTSFSTAPAPLSTFFRKERRSKDSSHDIPASDEFSVHSLPIQYSDIDSIEQTWNEQQEAPSKKFSTQTYSERGVALSSLHSNKSASDDHSTSKSIATESLGSMNFSGYTRTTSKTHATARRISTRRLSPHRELQSTSGSGDSTVVNGRGQTTSEQDEKSKHRSNKNGLPRHRHSRRKESRRHSRSTLRDDAGSISSQASNTSSNETSASTLEKEMYRLSLELATTLANLDRSTMEIGKYKKQVEDLETAVTILQGEKKAISLRLERYEHNRGKRDSGEIQISDKCLSTSESLHKPACVTPSHTSSNECIFSRRQFESHAIELSSPIAREEPSRAKKCDDHNESGMLFPELNESHISCSELYNNQTAEKSSDKDDNLGLDPKDEVFDDDPFATLNYSSEAEDDSVTSASSFDKELGIYHPGHESANNDDNSIISNTIIAAQAALSAVNSFNHEPIDRTDHSVFSLSSVKNTLRNGRQQVMTRGRHKPPVNDNRRGSNSNESFMSFQSKQQQRQQPSSDQSGTSKRLNLSKIFNNFGGGASAQDSSMLSVSIHSIGSKSRSSFKDAFGRKSKR